MTDYYYLDNVDRKILNILQKDSRTPFSRLAKMLDLSESTIHMRVKRLVKEGVIKNFGIEIDLDRIGLNVFSLCSHQGGAQEIRGNTKETGGDERDLRHI